MTEKTTTIETRTTKTGSGDPESPQHPGPLDRAKGEVQSRVITSKAEKTVTEKRTKKSS